MHQQFIERDYFGSLNALRFISALAVVKLHTHFVTPGISLFNLGYLGVDMFFAISGFLIVTLLLRERDSTGSINLRKFYVRRTLRIFPIYYLLAIGVFMFYLVISPIAPNGANYYKGVIPILLTYTQNLIYVPLGFFFHTWSLAMEEQFYLVWPSIEKYLTFGVKLSLIAIVLIVSQCSNFGLFDGWLTRIYGENRQYMYMFGITFTPIIFGVLLAYALHHKTSFNVVWSLVSNKATAFVLLAAIALICQLSTDGLGGWPRLSIHVAMTLLLASLVVREDHFASFFVNHKLLTYGGAISYGIYLYHPIIIKLSTVIMTKAGLSSTPMAMFIMVSLITFAVAHYSHKHIEKPLIRMGKRSA